MTTATYLAQYGIAEQSLSPEVKDGIGQVVKSAGYAAIQELGKILAQKAQQYGVTGSGSVPDTKAQQKAAADALAAQQKADALAKKKRVYTYIIVSVVVLLAATLFIIKRSKRP